jgi:hypothetical protein
VAVIGLFVTLVFNTIGVWRDEKQARQTRAATEVSLLSQLSVGLSEAGQAVTSFHDGKLIERRCDPYLIDPGAESHRLWQLLEYHDFLAWLFNRDYVTTEGAYEYWAPSLVDTYHLVTGYLPKKEIDERFDDLAYFRRTTPKRLFPESFCLKDE